VSRPARNLGRPQRWLRWKTVVPGSMDRLPVVPRNRWTNAYVHEIHGADGRYVGLHDHPWWSLSIVLQGELREYVHEYPALNIERRRRDLAHWRIDPPHVVARRFAYMRRNPLGGAVLVDVPRVKLRPPGYSHALVPVTPVVRTLFLTGPVVAQWGFHTPLGFLPQRHRREAVRIWADMGIDWARKDRDSEDVAESGA